MLQKYLRSFKGLSPKVWLLSLVLLINRAGSMVLPFLSVYLHDHLHFTLPDIGWIMSIYGIGAFLGSYIGGQLTDRFQYDQIMIVSLLFSGIGFVLLQFAHTFYSFGFMMFSTVLFADTFRPASMTAIGAYSKPEDYTRSLSLIRLAINLGYSIGPAIGGWIAFNLGYRQLFWIDGLTCIAAGIAVGFYLRDQSLPQKGKKNRQERQAESPYRNKEYLFFILMVSLMAIVFLQIITTIPLYFREHFKMTEEGIGLLLALNALLIVVIEMPIVHSLEKKGDKIRLFKIGVLLIGFSYFVFLLAPNWIWIAGINMLIISVGEIFAMPFSNAYCMTQTTPENRGKYMALYSMAYSFAFIFAPVIGMQIANSYGFPTLWVVLSVVSIITLLGLTYIQRNHNLSGSKPVDSAN